MSLLSARHYSGHGGLRLAADVGGPPDGEPVIFLHGGGQTRWSWGSAAEILCAKGHRVIALDARGHGESAWAAAEEYRLEHFVVDLRAVISTLDQAPALVGASLGGVTALAAIGESETPIARALVMVDVTPRIDPEGAKKIGGFMRGKPEGFASLEEAAEAVAAYVPHRPRPKTLDGLRKNLRLGSDGRYRWHWDPNFLQGAELHPIADEVRLSQAARAVQVPTLLVRGGRSEIVSAEAAKEFLALIPNAEYVEIGDAHHMVAGDSNNAFSAAVLSFLARHRA